MFNFQEFLKEATSGIDDVKAFLKEKGVKFKVVNGTVMAAKKGPMGMTGEFNTPINSMSDARKFAANN